MRKLSQKELVQEGFASGLGRLVGGTAKLAGKAASGLARTITPTGAKVAKQLGKAVSDSYGIGGGKGKGKGKKSRTSPSAKGAVMGYFKQPSIRSKYTNAKIESIKKIDGKRALISVSAEARGTGERVVGQTEAYRVDEGPLSSAEWEISALKLAPAA